MKTIENIPTTELESLARFYESKARLFDLSEFEVSAIRKAIAAELAERAQIQELMSQPAQELMSQPAPQVSVRSYPDPLDGSGAPTIEEIICKCCF